MTDLFVSATSNLQSLEPNVQDKSDMTRDIKTIGLTCLTCAKKLLKSAADRGREGGGGEGGEGPLLKSQPKLTKRQSDHSSDSPRVSTNKGKQ